MFSPSSVSLSLGLRSLRALPSTGKREEGAAREERIKLLEIKNKKLQRKRRKDEERYFGSVLKERYFGSVLEGFGFK